MELAELSQFVTELYTWGGYARKSEWARDAGFPAPNLSDVMNGKAGIEGYNLMRLYKAAEKRAASERPVTVADDQELREFVQRLLELVREGARRLGVEEADA